MSIERAYRWLVGVAVALLVLDLVDWLVNDDHDAVWIGVGVVALLGIATLSRRRYLQGERRMAHLQSPPPPESERGQNGAASH